MNYSSIEVKEMEKSEEKVGFMHKNMQFWVIF